MTPNAEDVDGKVPYHGKNTIMIGNGSGINISHIGQTSIPMSIRSTITSIALHVPSWLSVYSQLHSLVEIMIAFLNLILMVFALRIRRQARYCIKDNFVTGFIPYQYHHLFLL